MLIIIAMHGEAKPLIENLSLEHKGRLLKDYPMEYYQGENHGRNIHLVVNGQDPKYHIDRVGSQPTAVTTFAAIEKFNPDYILNIGTVGALKKKGAKLGDVYLANKVIFLDRRIPLDDYLDYGLGNYTTAGTEKLAHEYKLKFANLCTSNSLGLTEPDWKIFVENNCIINDMEAASIADLARIKNIPFYAIKVVTNLLDSPTKTDAEDFINNFDLAISNVTLKSLPFIKNFVL